jgi:hypothetical protein
MPFTFAKHARSKFHPAKIIVATLADKKLTAHGRRRSGKIERFLVQAEPGPFDCPGFDRLD